MLSHVQLNPSDKTGRSYQSPLSNTSTIDFWILDRKEAAPRFILKPASSTVPENSTVNLHASIIAASDPIVNWYYDGEQLTQSLKHMQKYSGMLNRH